MNPGNNPWGPPAAGGGGNNPWGPPPPPATGGGSNIWGPPPSTGGTGSAWGFPPPSAGGGGSNPWGPPPPPPPTSGGSSIWSPTPPPPPPPQPSWSGGWAASLGGASNIWGRGVDQDTQRVNEATRIADRARNLMGADPRFEFEQRLGGVHNGTAALFRDRSAAGRGRGRFVVKAATPDARNAVRIEKICLERLQYAEHVVRLVTISDNPLVNLGVPFFVTEYLQGGNLMQFQKRARLANEILPNRILWAIFLCLVRGCIGLAWNPQGAAVQLERTSEDFPSSLTHGDLQNENLAFGDVDPDTAEHERVPVLKMIDFGEAHERSLTAIPPLNEFFLARFDGELNLQQYNSQNSERNQATDKNIEDIGCVMGRIIARREWYFINDVRASIRRADVHPGLDPDLRLLVQRCLAVDPRNKPGLAELMRLVDGGAFVRSAAHYGMAGEPGGPESDARVEFLVGEYILSAETS